MRHLILKAPQYLSYKFSINIVRFIYLHKHSVRDSSVGRVMHRTVIPPPFTFSRSVTEYSRGFNITTVLLDCLIEVLGYDYLWFIYCITSYIFLHVLLVFSIDWNWHYYSCDRESNGKYICTISNSRWLLCMYTCKS